MNLEAGQPLLHYRLTEKLGEGGMGIVLRGHDDSLDRAVAIKLLRQQTQGDDAQRRMQREARAMARLSHPNVVQVYEVGVDDGRPFIAMELVDGVTLTEWLDAHPTASTEEIVDVFVRAGLGLAALIDDDEPAPDVVGEPDEQRQQRDRQHHRPPGQHGDGRHPPLEIERTGHRALRCEDDRDHEQDRNQLHA